ncbi:MAG: PIG-L family deacetylase, partial [Gammaproteobacteria bacterium]
MPQAQTSFRARGLSGVILIRRQKLKDTLLAVFAHPDDECFGTGGTLAKHAANGGRVVLACATRGEAGEISDPALATPDTLGTVREAELRASCAVLGIEELHLLGYRDSGMEGTPENDDPRCYHQADPAEAARQLVALIREVRPQVVITFEPGGGYGHPDHIAVSRHTTAAYDLADDPEAYPEAGEVWQPQRLFYTAIPTSTFDTLRERMEALGLDTSMFDRAGAIRRSFTDDEITTVLDVSAHLDTKYAAFDCHRTQHNPDGLF